ncbi:MAG: rRNA methyltransferase [Alphaproteobacteria bacterium]|jgi:23S rRNA (uridine2552-2'-O)-methyltransferase|nr:MAG: rRNA methyltransferase [Alphaproteobacteria bacterium]
MSNKTPKDLSGHRKQSIKLRTARGRTNSSQRWLQRQLNDPYVQKAKAEGYRSRAAYKLIEINDKYKLIQPGTTVVDLGAAPGGWSQVLSRYGNNQTLIALDLLEMDPLEDVTFIQGDFTDEDIYQKLLSHTKNGIDTVLSDMAPVTTGHKKTDHIRIMDLVEQACYFAIEVLKPDGSFVAKTLQGGGQDDVMLLLKKNFRKVSHFKPPSSRKESSEMYVIAQEFKG